MMKTILILATLLLGANAYSERALPIYVEEVCIGKLTYIYSYAGNIPGTLAVTPKLDHNSLFYGSTPLKCDLTDGTVIKKYQLY